MQKYLIGWFMSRALFANLVQQHAELYLQDGRNNGLMLWEPFRN